MIIAVVDTNVLVSGILSPHGAPGRIVDLLRDGVVKPGVDDRIWNEYETVLRREKFGFDDRDVTTFLQRLRYVSVFAPALLRPIPAKQFPDPADVPFLECALSLGAPLITGNSKHFPAKWAEGVSVVSPNQFIKQYLQ